MFYKRIELPYKSNELEPFIDKETVENHYGGHHKIYEDKLNKLLDGHADLKIQYPTLLDLMKNYQRIQDRDIKIGVREVGGGLINHNFYWEILKPNVTLNDGLLKEEIEKQWGSLEVFKEEFKKEVATLFGSGWVWLVKKNRTDSELKIIKTFNQDNPWFLGFTPIIGMDLWEHAYYLKHQYKRLGHFEDFWNCINWEKAESNFKESL